MAERDREGILDQLPPRFWNIRYDGKVTPKNAPEYMDETANCVVYAYEVLAHFGRAVPRFWSSELWADASSTRVVDTPEPLDLMLFAAEPVAYAAHVGVYVGEGRVLHLCKEVGAPVVWSLREFAQVATAIRRWSASSASSKTRRRARRHLSAALERAPHDSSESQTPLRDRVQPAASLVKRGCGFSAQPEFRHTEAACRAFGGINDARPTPRLRAEQ